MSPRSREPGLPQEGREPGGRQLHKCQLHHGECPACLVSHAQLGTGCDLPSTSLSPQNWLISGRCRLCLAPQLPSEQFSHQHPSSYGQPGCWEAEEGVWVVRTAREGGGSGRQPTNLPSGRTGRPAGGGLGAHDGPGEPPGLKTPPSFSIFFGYFTLRGVPGAGAGQEPLPASPRGAPRALGGGSSSREHPIPGKTPSRASH